MTSPDLNDVDERESIAFLLAEVGRLSAALSALQPSTANGKNRPLDAHDLAVLMPLLPTVATAREVGAAGRVFTTAEAANVLPLLPTAERALGGSNANAVRKRLGWLLARATDREVAGFIVKRVTGRSNAAAWMVVRVGFSGQETHQNRRTPLSTSTATNQI